MEALADAAVQLVSTVPHDGDDESLYLGVITGRPVAITRGTDTILLEPNDLVFCAPDRRRSPRFDDDCVMTVFRIPRCYLGVPEADLDRVAGMTARGRVGLGALVSDFLTALAAGTDSLRPTTAARLARSAMDLVTVLVRELLDEETDTGTAHHASSASQGDNELLSRIRTYIEEHLRDPDLSPEPIARAHHISLRYLHKLFQNDGTTVGRWVRQRRLDSCRHELSRTPNRRTTVAAVAHRWGFSSPAHFSRTFRDAYGMSPSEWRLQAASDSGTPT